MDLESESEHVNCFEVTCPNQMQEKHVNTGLSFLASLWNSEVTMSKRLGKPDER